MDKNGLIERRRSPQDVSRTLVHEEICKIHHRDDYEKIWKKMISDL